MQEKMETGAVLRRNKNQSLAPQNCVRTKIKKKVTVYLFQFVQYHMVYIMRMPVPHMIFSTLRWQDKSYSALQDAYKMLCSGYPTVYFAFTTYILHVQAFDTNLFLIVSQQLDQPLRAVCYGYCTIVVSHLVVVFLYIGIFAPCSRHRSSRRSTSLVSRTPWRPFGRYSHPERLDRLP
jgi:hypothetical protein